MFNNSLLRASRATGRQRKRGKKKRERERGEGGRELTERTCPSLSLSFFLSFSLALSLFLSESRPLVSFINFIRVRCRVYHLFRILSSFPCFGGVGRASAELSEGVLRDDSGKERRRHSRGGLARSARGVSKSTGAVEKRCRRHGGHRVSWRMRRSGAFRRPARRRPTCSCRFSASSHSAF